MPSGCGVHVYIDIRTIYVISNLSDFYSHSGGWKSVHSARRPLNGLLYLPRVTVKMENLVE
jgi:hypothetical protein